MTNQESDYRDIIKEVVSTTAQYYGLDAIIFWSENSSRYVVSARRVAIYVCYEIFNIPQWFIAKEFKINQGTVSKAVKDVIAKGKDDYSVTISYFKNYIKENKEMSLEPKKLAIATDKPISYFKNYIKENKEMSLEPKKLAIATDQQKDDTINRLERTIIKVRGQLREKTELAKSLQEQLDTTENEGVDLRNKLADSQGDVAEAVDKLSKVQAKLDTTEKRLSDGQEKLKLAYIDNNRLREELAETRALYEKANINYIKLKNKGILKFAIEKVAGCIKRN